MENTIAELETISVPCPRCGENTNEAAICTQSVCDACDRYFDEIERQSQLPYGPCVVDN
jgi:NMD protein affecting ribosome stability and mRNA decay